MTAPPTAERRHAVRVDRRELRRRRPVVRRVDPRQLTERRAGNPTVSESTRSVGVGLYPIVTFQYSPTTLYQVSYHIQYLFF